MDSSTPGFPGFHYLLELAHTHVHWVTDVIQPSHPLSSPSPPAFKLSQHSQTIAILMSLKHGNSLLLNSFQFTRSVVSDSLWPHGLQHTRLPCRSSTPRASLNSCPLSQWCHPTISSSVIPFSSCPQSFPGSRSLMSQLFTSGGQSIELQLQHQSIDLFDLLTVQGTLRSLLQHYSLKALILWHSAFFMVQLSHLYMTTGKKAGGEGDDRGWDGWMASTQWTWVWVSSGSWWSTGKPVVLQSMGSQRVGHN